ncbi:MAG: hypothetical protein M3P93_02640 [Actinomycetota bacterium]|nr:hypothetical protein [Actinomycetota bacterium]
MSSTDYPNDGKWYGAAGTAGSFTLDPPEGDTTAVQWRLNNGPRSAPIATTGAPVSITLTPTVEGPHTLKGYTRDRAGNRSASSPTPSTSAPAR